MKIEIKRKNENFQLEATNEAGNHLIIDLSKDGGGDDGGYRPMQMVLTALGGCSSMDVLTILKKQRLEPFDLKVTLDGERETGKEANLWKTIHVHYAFKGNLPKEKAERAVQLSLEKYCSVAKTLEAGGTKITSEVIIAT
ncbi:MAG: OsmC family protein [Bacteroidota bacterium]|jgi:putative redox protein